MTSAIINLSTVLFSQVLTIGMPFLKLGVGARPVAMGEAFTAVSDDANAMFWNPAGMGMHEGAYGTLMIMNLLRTVTYTSGALVVPVSRTPQASIGFAGAYLSAVDTLRDEQGTAKGQFGLWDALGAVGVGWKPKSYLSIGATAKFVASKIERYYAYSLMGDLGLMVNPTDYLYFGLLAQNLGTPRRFISDIEFPPATLRGGLALRFPLQQSHLLFSADLAWPINDLPSLGVGGEFKLYMSPEQAMGSSGLSVQAGYRSGYHLGDWGGLSIGIGYEYEVTPVIHMNLNVVYFSYGFLGSSERLSLSASFRPTAKPRTRHRNSR